MVELVQCFDVVQDDVVSRVNVLVAAQVISAVQESSCMMTKACSKGLSEGRAVSWGQSLCFNAPEGYRLYASFVQAEPDFQSRDFQSSQLQLPLPGLLKSLT